MANLSARLAEIVEAIPLRAGMRVIEQVRQTAADLISAGRLTARQAAAEDLTLDPDEDRYDLAFAVRVGALDGRHPEAGARALERLPRALVPDGRLFIDGGDPLREVVLPTAAGGRPGPPSRSGPA